MGTPKSVYRSEPQNIPTVEILQGSAMARNVAQFRTEEKREAALEQLRRWLAPMVQWLDKPISDLLHDREEKKSLGGKTRVLVLFDLSQRTNGCSAWLGIDRDGNWIVPEYSHATKKWRLTKLDGETLERMIWTWREKFLGDTIGRVQRQYEERVMSKSPELEDFTQHACFLGFVNAVVASVNKSLKEREERLHTMRENLSVIESFGLALDPLRYRACLMLPGYSVWQTRPGHGSRCSADYLVSEPVEQAVVDSNATHEPSEGERYTVMDSPVPVANSHAALRRVADILTDAQKGILWGPSSRTEFSDKEVAALERFVQDACSFP